MRSGTVAHRACTYTLCKVTEVHCIHNTQPAFLDEVSRESDVFRGLHLCFAANGTPPVSKAVVPTMPLCVILLELIIIHLALLV